MENGATVHTVLGIGMKHPITIIRPETRRSKEGDFHMLHKSTDDLYHTLNQIRTAEELEAYLAELKSSKKEMNLSEYLNYIISIKKMELKDFYNILIFNIFFLLLYFTSLIMSKKVLYLLSYENYT